MARPPKPSSKFKLENNWRSKTLETLEKDYWGEPTYPSHLVTTCHKLRKKRLGEFEVEDLRIMIGQDTGLQYLIPMAIEILKSNVLADGDFYDGDLLVSVLKSEPDYWKLDQINWKLICELFEKNRSTLETCATTKDIRNSWFDSFEAFKKINL